ncbi:hypothetical protein P3T36_003342 [Kitasatospora sp. MAP12-15]|uniref:hypothetical protein n=1 Tax=unclassified Kitasatospora TaxID=2633591 RepID=UPI002476ABB1|nr:hypothetical protein [Kitasatospora sp. MAP12-44]MDH6111318.1 hypothetical protein [Kitasatospora sp. MAP12-44]
MLEDFGFRPLPDRTDMVLRRADQNIFLQARQAVAAMRARGVKVSADPAFDYTPATRPPSPSALAAGPDAVVVSASPSAHRHDVTIGNHPRHGVVATVPSDQPFAVSRLQQAGFIRADDHMYTVGRGPEAAERATDAVRELRKAGLTVATDLAYEPLDEPYVPTDPFATKLIAAMERTPPSPTPAQAEAQALDPFFTRLIPAADRTPRPQAAPQQQAPTLDPFGTRLVPAGEREVRPSVGEQRDDALVHDRVSMMNEISARLRGIEQQLRTDPSSLDAERVEAVIAQASTTLSATGKELAGVAARSPRPALTAPAASPRARAALARSSRVQVGATLGAAEAANSTAAAPAIDPRKAYANYR